MTQRAFRPAAHRIPPAPQRNRTTCRRFLFTKASPCSLRPLFMSTAPPLRIFFVIEVSARYVHVLGLTAYPDGATAAARSWMSMSAITTSIIRIGPGICGHRTVTTSL